MPSGVQSKGVCVYCGQEVPKGGIAKHLVKCPPRQAAIAKAAGKQGMSETLYHLRVQAAGAKEFWLDLEVPGSGLLKDVDHYLRAIWLECCGHLSRFSVGGWGTGQIPMTRRIDDGFGQEGELTHIYDFGTSSETLVRVVGTRVGKATTAQSIALMVRNQMPASRCVECEQPATWLCRECLIENDIWGTLCDEHVAGHPHSDYGDPILLVNSPRLGMCGYTGPADPPY